MVKDDKKALDPAVQAAVKDLFLASDVFRQAYSEFLRGSGPDAAFRLNQLEDAQARLDEARNRASEAELSARGLRYRP
jgi:hypothetical protein